MSPNVSLISFPAKSSAHYLFFNIKHMDVISVCSSGSPISWFQSFDLCGVEVVCVYNSSLSSRKLQ